MQFRHATKLIDFNGRLVEVTGQISRELTETERALFNINEPAYIVEFDHNSVAFREIWKKIGVQDEGYALNPMSQESS